MRPAPESKPHGDKRNLLDQLDHAETSGLIRISQLEPDLSYLFRHAIVQDATYHSILKRDRARLHKEVAASIEEMHPSQPEKVAAVLGFHYHAAGDDQKALHYFRLAADHALASYANSEAGQHYRSALALVPAGVDRAALLDRLGQSLHLQAHFSDAVTVWREALPLYLAAGDTSAAAQLYARIARAQSMARDRPASLATALEGIEALRDAPDSTGVAALLHETGRSHLMLSHWDEGRTFCERALAMAQAIGAVDIEADTLCTHAMNRQRSFEDRRATLMRAVEISEEIGLLRVATRAHFNLARVLQERGIEPDSQYRHFTKSLEIDALRGDLTGQMMTLLPLLWYDLGKGDFVAGTQHLGDLQALVRELPDLAWFRAHALMYEAQRAQQLGEFDEAARVYQQAAAYAEEQKVEIAALLYASLGDNAYEQGKLESAETAYRRAIEITEPEDVQQVQSRLMLAMVRAKQGRIDEADALLAEAKAHPAVNIDESELAGSLAQANAEIASAKGDWDAVLNHLEAYEQFEASYGRRYGVARTLLRRAAAHLSRSAAGDIDHARTLLHRAESEFAAMDVSFYQHQAQLRLTELEKAHT